ncbi:MAG: hypothetical protein O2879_01370 [Proteobacteria bacterium]|nr:hypothetical protein [Pseudomonadota bacterium]
MTLSGSGGTGHVRVDWFTTDGLPTWGDGLEITSYWLTARARATSIAAMCHSRSARSWFRT